jgi:hypothetical protein
MSKGRILGVVLAGVLVGGWWWTARPSGDLLPPARAAAADGFAGRDLGFSAALEEELKRMGQISPAEFGRRFGGKISYVPQLSWDPTSATFWDRFNLDPGQKGSEVRVRGAEERKLRDAATSQGKPVPDDQPILISASGGYDFRLKPEELAKFKENGFVVSERMGAASCTDMFYRIYKRDLPVFVSADAVLHAWHRSYDEILVEIETALLMPALDDILAGMSAKVPEARRAYGDTLCGASIADADCFLTVARSLLAGKKVPSVLGQDERVVATLQACAGWQLLDFELFGKQRRLDFSQFKPRGHYEKSEELRRYFQAMMWCGRIDLRVAGNPQESSPGQLAAAIVFHDLLQRAGKFERWRQFDHMIRTFVGKADSMTFGQMSELLRAAAVKTPADVKDETTLAALQRRIELSKFGAQEIRGDVFDTDPHNPEKFVLPRSFTFLGQRFAVDSWVTAKVVFDDVRWNSEAVMRRVPSCLDVAFAAFANDHIVPTLVERLNNPAGRKFRDGLNYQHNLAAARQVIDAKPATLWQESLYTGWLGSLRELSKPTTDAKYPETMRTQAWAMKTLNTQLASWTQLRHDSILYVKQSYTARPLCHYPAGYVEPVPHFWASMEQTARRAAALIDKTPYPQPGLQKKHAAFLRNFEGKMTALRSIAEKELEQKELTKDETKFLEDVVEMGHVRIGSGSMPGYVGWYPGLFYLGGEDSKKWDALVADIHTNPPAPIVLDPGCVVHQGVGSVDLLIVAIDSGRDRMIYAGPVLSHYEFEMSGVARKTDAEWKADLTSGIMPPRPEWTRAYLVPGMNKDVKQYK